MIAGAAEGEDHRERQKGDEIQRHVVRISEQSARPLRSSVLDQIESHAVVEYDLHRDVATADNHDVDKTLESSAGR
jgi:hypothetical protein